MLLFKELFLVLERYMYTLKFKISIIIKININPLSESFIGLTIVGTTCILTILNEEFGVKIKKTFVFKPKIFGFFVTKYITFKS